MRDISYWIEPVDTWRISKIITNGYQMTAEHLHTHHELSFNFSYVPIRHSISGHLYETNTPYIVYRAPFTLHSSNTLNNDPYIRYKLDLNPYLFSIYDGIISMGNFHNANENILFLPQMTKWSLSDIFWICLTNIIRLEITIHLTKPALDFWQQFLGN